MACAGKSPTLPFDLAPQMAGLRQDAAAIAVFLARERLADAVAPADRLTRFELPPARDAAATVHQDLVAYAASFKTAAEQLKAALVAKDRALAGERFDAVVTSCTACHREFRPGGVTSLELEASGER